MASLSEQMKIQQMYNEQIKSKKSEVELLQDELQQTQSKLQQVKKTKIRKDAE